MIVDSEVERYAAEHSTPEPPHLAALAEETRRLFPDNAVMMVGQLEGRFLALMVSLSGARRVLEIGTFTGYSALSMAEALPADGTIVTCELDPDWAAVARRHFDASPFADRIELRLGPALETVVHLPGPFDLVFIDADKQNYPNYYEAVLPKLAPDGVMLVDNVLWSGEVVDPAIQSETTQSIRAFNDRVRDDPRVTCVVLTVRDGVSVIRPA